MTAERLQQLVVRMHHDPLLVGAVYDTPQEVAVREGLSRQQVDLLRAPDRRAWGADAQRRDRVLEALRAEYPVSCALVELEGKGRDTLLDFFSSSYFHRCVGRWGIQALAFADFLNELSGTLRGELLGDGLAQCLRLERALAQVRRSSLPEGPEVGATLPQRLRTAPWVATVSLRRGTLALHGELRDWLSGGEAPVLGSLGDQEAELLLIERTDQEGGLSIGELPRALFEVVERAVGGASRDALLHLLEEGHGAEKEEAADVLESLLSEQVLVRAVPH